MPLPENILQCLKIASVETSDDETKIIAVELIFKEDEEAVPTILKFASQDVIQKMQDQMSDLVRKYNAISQSPVSGLGSDSITDATDVDTMRALELLLGQEGLFARYLHTNFFYGGTGKVCPGVTSLTYAEDAFRAAPDRLKGWPTGFYTDFESRDIQLHVRTETYSVVVGSVPNNSLIKQFSPILASKIMVHKHTEPDQYSKPLYLLSKEEILAVNQQLEITLGV